MHIVRRPVNGRVTPFLKCNDHGDGDYSQTFFLLWKMFDNGDNV